MSNNVYALRRLSGWLVVAVGLLLMVSAVVWLYRSPYFPVRQIKIEGRLKHADAGEIRALAQQYIRGNILNTDVNGAQAAFARLPWIADAQVSRLLPDTVVVRLEERIAVARWDEETLADTQGELFGVPYDQPLPSLEGPAGTEKDMVEHLLSFQNILKKRNLTVAKLVYTPRSAWSVVLDNGITVRLGREYERERLKRFAEVWPVLLEPQAAELEYVDMRYKDGFAVRKTKL
ncbi:MAG: cell division protein FtsQ/DivIB [Neisseria sp.]|nr:cell division protein FtsQ/DivIB [Neisseria sp.]